MNKVLERGKRFCGYVVGIVFFLSGIVKLLDPVGAGLVMSEYYNFMHVGFMDFSAKASAFALAMIETLLGAALITGLWRRIVSIITMCFLGFFTLLSLALLIFNPPMDCGCFGEVLHLTHLQTFLKNIALCALSAASFFPLSALGKPKRRKYVSFSIVTVTVICFAVYSLMFIPLKDYTDFRPGVRVSAAEHNMPEIYDGDTYEAVFIYEKNGKKETFTLDNLPDSTWTFVSTETRRTDDPSSSEMASSDLSVSLPLMDRTGVSRDDLMVGAPVFVISVYKVRPVAEAKWRRISEMLYSASDSGYRSILLVASTPEDFSLLLSGMNDRETAAALETAAYFSDYRTLVSLNRSNGGATYFNGGYLIRKWASRSYPDEAEISSVSAADVTETYLSYSSSGALIFQGILLFTFAVMLLL